VASQRARLTNRLRRVSPLQARHLLARRPGAAEAHPARSRETGSDLLAARPSQGWPGKEMLKALFAFCRRKRSPAHRLPGGLRPGHRPLLVQGVDICSTRPAGHGGLGHLRHEGPCPTVAQPLDPRRLWCEGYQPEAGWAIGKGEEYEDHVYQDQVESNASTTPGEGHRAALLRPRRRRPAASWILRMKRSMKQTPTFSTNRMLFEYGEHFYRPAAAQHTG